MPAQPTVEDLVSQVGATPKYAAINPALVRGPDGDDPVDTRIATLRRGQSFGEVALVDEGLRSATARAAMRAGTASAIARTRVPRMPRSGRNSETAESGARPIPEKPTTRRAVSDATRRSQARMIPRAAPATGPLMAARTGFSNSRICLIKGL